MATQAARSACTVDLTLACIESIFPKQNKPSRNWVENVISYTGFVYSELLPLELTSLRAGGDAKDQIVATVIYLTNLFKIGSDQAVVFYPDWIENVCNNKESCHAYIGDFIDRARIIITPGEARADMVQMSDALRK